MGDWGRGGEGWKPGAGGDDRELLHSARTGSVEATGAPRLTADSRRIRQSGELVRGG